MFVQQSLDNLRHQRLTRINAAQFAGPMGALAASTTYALLRGEKVPAQQLVPTFPVTRETLARYPGWTGPIPADFDKPWPSKTPRWQGQVWGTP